MAERSTVFVLHLVANALLLWLGYRWLGMNESNGSQLAGSFSLAALILVAFVFIHGFALATFSGLSLRQAALRTLQRLLPLTCLGLLAIGIYALLAWVQASYARPAFAIASFLTMHLRKPVPPGAVQGVFHFVVGIFRWAVVPAALLRIAGGVINRGANNERFVTRWFPLFALFAAVLLFCAIWVPLRLFYWIPDFKPFSVQFASFLIRIAVGYLLFVTGALVLEYLTVSGSPVDTQRSTVS